MKILVTGGNGGLGKEICNQLNEMKEVEHNYFHHDIEIVTMGREDCDVNIDLGHLWELWVEKIKDLKRFDGIIHCAGKNKIETHEKLNVDDIEDLIMVNAISNFIINREMMRRNDLKFICHIISDAAWTPMTHSLAYNVSKAAQLMVMRQMAHERKPNPVIFGVSPGKIAGTGMSKYINETFPGMRGMTYTEGRDYQLSRLRTGEMGVKSVANFVANLCMNVNQHFHGLNFPLGG